MWLVLLALFERVLELLLPQRAAEDVVAVAQDQGVGAVVGDFQDLTALGRIVMQLVGVRR